MMPPPWAAEVHGTSDYLLGFFVGKNAKKSPPKIGEEPIFVFAVEMIVIRFQLLIRSAGFV